MLLVYYVPIWFQAIKGVSAVKSGIDTIPMVLSLVVGTILSGQATSRLGYYTPFAYASVVIMTIGAGLISTWTISTGHSMWIGYEILFGFGLGIGMQQGNMAAQTVLDRKDVPMGISLVMLTQMLGGAIFISVGQNILDKNLVSGIAKLVPGIDPKLIVNTGATALRNLVPAEKLPEILIAYNDALRQVFLVAVGTGAAAAIGALALEWKSVKGPKEGKTKEAGETKPADVSEKV
jgi:MFS family permease